MSNVTIKQVTYGTWGDCIEISNGIVDLVATVNFGPRIIRYGFVGGVNQFMEDPENRYHGNPQDIYGQAEWRIYGGHRLWTSPEAQPRTTYPDKEPVVWEKTERGVVLTSHIEQWTQVRKEIEICLHPESSEVSVKHRITNKGAWPVQFAVWALSVMATGGTAIFPQPKLENGLLANRVFALWPYSKMNDERIHWGDRYITLKQGTGNTPFKFGYNNEAGWAAYTNSDVIFIKQFPHLLNGNYPDYGVSLESYVCDHFLELESLGELKFVQPEETVTHDEVWHIFNHSGFQTSNETVIDQVLSSYLKK